MHTYTHTVLFTAAYRYSYHELKHAIGYSLSHTYIQESHRYDEDTDTLLLLNFLKSLSSPASPSFRRQCCSLDLPTTVPGKVWFRHTLTHAWSGISLMYLFCILTTYFVLSVQHKIHAEDKRQQVSLFSFQHVGPGDVTEDVRLEGIHLYPLSSLWPR